MGNALTSSGSDGSGQGRAEAKPLPVIPAETLAGGAADAGAAVLAALEEHGFFVVDFASAEAEIPALASRLKGLAGTLLDEGDSDGPLGQAVHGEGANIGWCRGSLRDYLKMRRDEASVGWPTSEVREVYEAFFDAVWGLMMAAVEAADDVAGAQSGAGPVLDAEGRGEIRDCTRERSTVGLIRYRPPRLLDEAVKAASDEYAFEDSGAGRHVICGTHEDTGIATGVMVGDVPGLEVLDRATGEWVDVEAQLLERGGAHAHMVVMGGEKASMFVGSRKIKATTHRVSVDDATGGAVPRYSLLLFLDTVDPSKL